MVAIKKFYQGLYPLCMGRLQDALEPSSGLFSRQLRNKKWESVVGTEDMTSTAICLIGLARANVEYEQIGLDTEKTIKSLVQAARAHNYHGGFGLMVWANAVIKGVPLNKLSEISGISLENAEALVTPITTMEAAWLVCGLVHEYHRRPSDKTKCILNAAANELLSRFNKKTKLFHHASERAPLLHRLRKSVPNFADQIYSVQALSYLALLMSNQQALDVAAACANHLIELQGELGQWWWHYNSQSGNIAQPFPVYSVHQHAMAPMALMTLTSAGGGDYSQVMALSCAWLNNNELHLDMVDRQAGTIWRDIEPADGSFAKFVRFLYSVSGRQFEWKDLRNIALKVNYETRPYEWAWCLFAHALVDGSEPGPFVA